MADMTPEEIAFFETGELPAGLAAEHEASVAAQAAEAEVPAELAPAPKLEPATQEVAPAKPVAAVQPEVTFSNDIQELLRQQQASFDAKLEELTRQFTARTNPAPEEVPDPIEDPLGHMMHQLKTVTTKMDGLDAARQADMTRQQINDFTTAVRDAKDTFKAATPDFDAAYAHIRALRAEDYRAAGAPESEIPKILLQDEYQLAQTAIQRGQNPAEALYNMAKRYGYATKAAAEVTTPSQKMEHLRAGQEAAKQPARAGAEVDLTLDGLKDMSSANMSKLVADDKLWNSVVGGEAATDIFNH